VAFSYNSNHKVITALIFIAWAIFNFVIREDSEFQYDNGQKKRTGAVKENKNNGLWTWYYDNGKKNMQGNFKNGKREGVWITWDTEGNKVIECEYSNDKLNGEYILWSKDEVIYQKTYINDKPI
jgi:antitoxin component YwqK of YwqJK toxin-antitoxin module